MRILIEGIDVLTADPAAEYIRNADIGIADDRIEFIVPAGQRVPDFIPDRKINGKNMLAMPGMVNAHTHCAMTLMRNAADDLPLHKWLFEKIFPIEDRLTDDAVYWGTRLAAAEMIKSGTTALADMYLHMDAAARGIVDTGMRVNLSKSPLEFHSEGGLKADDVFDDVRTYFKNWNGKYNGRIRVYLEVHSTYLFDWPSLIRASELAKELGTGIHIHLLETARERKESFEKHEKSSVEICAETGIFDVPVIGAHLVHIDEEDIRILKQYGVNAAHNPTSNLKLGSGISPVHKMLDAGVNVALGTDGTASNNNLNMFEEMHLAALIHKGVAQDPELVTARQAFMMATVNGSRAVGFGDETGILKPGMKADMILLDMDKPHLCPVNDPFSAVVYSAQASDVDTVIVDGNILMEKRELKTIDEERVMFEVRKHSDMLLE
ncbi:MAG TPA: amidohydrolase [Clostridiales bacterium]|nr:amidohydrolase [Clostridiales bacterium]